MSTTDPTAGLDELADHARQQAEFWERGATLAGVANMDRLRNIRLAYARHWGALAALASAAGWAISEGAREELELVGAAQTLAHLIEETR